MTDACECCGQELPSVSADHPVWRAVIAWSSGGKAGDQLDAICRKYDRLKAQANSKEAHS